MKKLITLLLLMCLLPLCALAEMDEDGNVTVTLSGAEVFFTPVEGAYLLTRESSASVFNQLGLSQRELIPYMESYDIYAMMFFGDTQGNMAEVQLCVYETTDMDFDDLTVYGQDMNCEVVEAFYKDGGYEVESVELRHTLSGHSYVKAVASYAYEDGSVEHVVEFYTCQSGYAVQVMCFPYDGPATEEQNYLLESLVDSLWVSESASGAANE